MRGYRNLNKHMFILVERWLRNSGYTVWNPATHATIPNVSLSECMILDLNAIINKCDGVVFLSGWRGSYGANVEAMVASVCNKTAFEICTDNNGLNFNMYAICLDSPILPYYKL